MTASTSTVQALLGDRKNTRLALAAALAERNAECEVLRAEFALLRERAMKSVAPHSTPARAEQLDRPVRKLPAHFAAAREAAMRMGRVVRVEPTAEGMFALVTN